MVAAEKGGPLLAEYLLCRTYCLSLKNREAFPETFCNEVQFYSGLLPPKSSKFEWGRYWNMSPSDTSNIGKVTASEKAQVACALGKNELKSGVHTWSVCVSDFRGKAWIGVARNSDHVACDPQTARSRKNLYVVYFESGGAQGVGGAESVTSVVFDQIRGSAFSSGQTVELKLDTLKSSLEMRIDGLTRCVAYNIEVSNIHAYVCFDNSGSATVVETSSWLLTQMSVISEDERSAGYDNSLWSSDLDNYLGQCFKLGTYLSIYLFIHLSAEN